MKEKLIGLFGRYREQVLYIVFGGATTVVNIVCYMLLAHFTPLSTVVANGIALAVSILFAYITNRIFVFESRAKGLDALRELCSFIACRLGTGLMDEGIMWLGVDKLGLWNLGVKVFSNVLVIVANYVFSKLLIFRKKDRA